MNSRCHDRLTRSSKMSSAADRKRCVFLINAWNRNKAEVTADAVTTALENAYGVHPGRRRNHTKGLCALGTCAGMGDATAYSRSALFSGSQVPVVARVSIAGGDPTVPDADRSPRGMALEFRPPDGSRRT